MSQLNLPATNKYIHAPQKKVNISLSLQLWYVSSKAHIGS